MYGLRKQAVCLLVMIMTVISAGCGEKEQSVELKEAQVSGSIEETTEETKEETKEDGEGMSRDEPGTIFVHVCGHVKEPGVYEFAAGSRICQAVEAAGGMLDTASYEAVNQAEKMQDGQQVYVPSKEEAENAAREDIKAPGTNGEIKDDGKININEADMNQLMSLSGIGQTKAQAILAYREEHGSFQSTDEIMKVEGIKEGTYTKIKDQIKAE